MDSPGQVGAESYRPGRNAASVRQGEWDREIEAADRQQAELFNLQWRLIRDQMGGLAREITTMRQEIHTFKVFEKQQEQRHSEHERRGREDFESVMAKHEGEKQDRTSSHDKLRLYVGDFSRSVEQVKSLIDGEIKSRTVAMEEMRILLSQELEAEARLRTAAAQELHKFPTQFRLSLEEETRARRENDEALSGTLRDALSNISNDLRREAEKRRRATVRTRGICRSFSWFARRKHVTGLLGMRR